jgi:hypothetical protein
MDNRADTDRIRDDIRTLGSTVARPCALARNSLGASQDRRGVCRGTVAAGAGVDRPLQPGGAAQRLEHAVAGRVLCSVVSQKQDTTCPQLSGAVQHPSPSRNKQGGREWGLVSVVSL